MQKNQVLHGPSTEFIATNPREERLRDWINGIFAEALENGYSDLHFETEHDSGDLVLRVRSEGVLAERDRLDGHDGHLLVNKIRARCRLSQNDTRAPQDGRFLQICGEKRADVRVSIVETGGDGVSLVMRLLDSANAGRSMESLEMPEAALRVFQREIRRNEGLILATGPTGSGKTTTLYAAMGALNTVARKNISIEDPIEYHLQGVQQVQVGEGTGRTFASVLRSVLRQDPDGILVGEIRDEETANIAAHAAMTGHLVLSTVHANAAIETLTRLTEMGVPMHVLLSSLRLIIAQRLVGRVCPHCARPREVNEEEARVFAGYGVHIPRSLLAAKGCEHCNHRGYKGRIAIFEMLRLDADFRRIARISTAEDDLLEAAKKQEQFVPLAASALRLAAQGITSWESAIAFVYDD